jgi:hypothetical protein
MSRAPSTAYGDPLGWPGTVHGLPYASAVELLAQRTGLRCYVFALDQAKRSGAAVHDVRAKRIVMRTHTRSENPLTASHERRMFMRDMRSLPDFDWSRVLVVFEDHSTIPLEFTRGKGPSAKKVVMGKKSILSLGATWGEWRELLNIVEHPPSQRILVEPKEWRRVLSTGCNVGTEAWKAQAKMWASAVVGAPVEDDNEAEACGIATWGAFDGLYLWARAQLAQKAKSA